MSTSTIPSDWSSLATINPEFNQLLSKLPSPDWQLVTKKTTIESLRQIAAGRPESEKWPAVQERDLMIPMRDGYENRIRVYNAKQENGPLLVMIHGGGFCLGNLTQEEGNCRNWVRDRGGVAVSIEHRLAPEAKFPVPVEDCWDILQWIAKNFKSWNADPEKGFVLGGTSSGATLSITLSHFARDEKLSPPLTGLFLSVPLPCFPGALSEPYASDNRIVSWTQNSTAPIFSSPALDLFARAYNADPKSPLRSPFLWPTGHKGLPPTYFQVAGLDPGRDYALIYEEVLRGEGVQSKIDLFPGLPHGFWAFFSEAEFAKEFHQKSRGGFEWLLAVERKSEAECC